MNLNKFTQKAQEAVLAAQSTAQEANHSQVEPVHLLAALLEQEQGVTPQIVNRIGVEGTELRRRVEEKLNELPRAVGATAQVGLSRELSDIARQAEREASNMRDEYVSTEHLFLALIDAAERVRSLRFSSSSWVRLSRC